MCSLDSDIAEERRAQFCRLGKLPGPRDEWRAGEDFTAARGLSLSEAGRKALGVRSEMMAQWFDC